MRLLNHGGRAVLDVGAGEVDVETASEGVFPADPQRLLADWDRFAPWARSYLTRGDQRPDALVPLDPAMLGSPAPRPAQVFAVGLNYHSHAEETGLAPATSMPLTFTKFPSSITGPHSDLTLTSDQVDWEIELVAVIGRAGHRIPVEHAWDHVAGVTVGQDFSDRAVQLAGSPPQFSLGKSFPGFAPLGPALVTPDELADPCRLDLRCTVNGETVQQSSTDRMIHPVAELVSMLSDVCPLGAGDLIFTGTPEGVGMGQVPPRYLVPGDVVISEIEGIGRLEQRCVAGDRVTQLAGAGS